MARTQIGSVWEYGNVAYDTTLPLPARTIAAGSLVVVVGRFEDDETTVTVSDTAGATWQVQTQFNANIQVFIAWSYNHPGQVNNVITATLGSTRPYRIISAIELDGSDASDPAQVANIVKSSAVLNHSMTVSTPCDIFAIQGCYSTSTITPTSPAVALTSTSSVLCLFSTRRDVSSSPATIANTGGGGNQASISLAFSYPGGGDTEKPVLTGTPNVGTKTSSTIQITGPAGSDNVGITAYEFSTDGGATWPLSSPTLPYNITSLAAGTSYTIGMRAKDAANNVSDPPIYVTTSTPTPDTTPPTMNGSITVGTKTSGSISISYPAASDNVAVTGYEVSTNGSTWSDNSTSLSYTFLGLSALTSYTLYVRAYDAAGNRAATPLTVTTSTYRAGDTAANILANTGPVGGNPAGFLYAFASTVTSTDWLSYTITSGPTPSGGTLTANPDGTFTYVGPDAATMVIQPEVNGVNAAETITVTLYDQSPDTELPVLTGSITVTNLTSTSYDMECPAGTDNVGVTGYEYSLNGGSSWTNNGNDRTASASGRTPESTDAVRWRCYDAAGNRSNELSVSVTLLAGPDVTKPLLSDPTAYASGPTTASGTVTTNEATGTLYFLRNNSATATDVAVEAGLSQAVTAAGIQTVNVTGLTASTPSNYIHYLHIDAAGNRSLVSSSAAFTTPATPAPGLKVIGAQPTKLIARPITRPIAIRQTD